MLMRGFWRSAKIALFAVSAGIFLPGLPLPLAHAQEGPRQAERLAEQTPQAQGSSSPGERIFAASCASCHGLDGQGTDRGPGIAESARVQRLSDAQLGDIISFGIPDTGMKPFRDLSADQIRNIVTYVRVLQGKHGPRSLPGDAGRGKQIFFGKGECSSCHAIYGAGGFLGPDLSSYGPANSTQTILDAILNTERSVPNGYRLATVTTRDGHRIEGLIRNEDNFSMQLLAQDGSFHFFRASDLQKVERSAQPLMPTNYRGRLSADELNDLVNFLVNGGASNKPLRASEEDDEGEDD
jgi:cytochrome c oxidase cbb3-type subunit III